MTKSELVSLNDLQQVYKPDYKEGEYILLSVEDYNKIVRSLNLLNLITAMLEAQSGCNTGNLRTLLNSKSLEVIE